MQTLQTLIVTHYTLITYSIATKLLIISDRSRIHLYNRTRNSREPILFSNTRLCRNNTSQAIQPQFANYNRAKPDIRHRQVQLIPNVFMRHHFLPSINNPFLKLERLKNHIEFKTKLISSPCSRKNNFHNFHNHCFIISFPRLIRFSYFRNIIRHEKHRYNIFKLMIIK